jgi:hypothetical protein
VLHCGRKTRPILKSEMNFTELLFRAFATMNFLTWIAGSHLVLAFVTMVRLSFPSHHSPPNITVQIHQHWPSFLTFIRIRLLTSSKPLQTGPVVGISFCLIIVRLGSISPRPGTKLGQCPFAPRPHDPMGPIRLKKSPSHSPKSRFSGMCT